MLTSTTPRSQDDILSTRVRSDIGGGGLTKFSALVKYPTLADGYWALVREK